MDHVLAAPATGRTLRAAAALFDRLETAWEGPAAQRRMGTLLVAAFLASVVAIELNRRGWLPADTLPWLTINHLGAIYVAFTLLLFAEVVGLVFALARSVADSVGKQFELLSLILLRKAFLEFAELPEPIRWEDVSPAIPHIAADIGGALLIFVVLGFYYRVQRHLPITADPDDRASFVAAKKLIAVVLLAAFFALVMRDAWSILEGRGTGAVFETFYTVLIFCDVLVVLVSLRYSSRYAVVFRNSGFAAATVLIRLALTAPAPFNALLGLGAALFALGLSLAYNTFAPVLAEQEDRED
ncbi:MAG TPA: hypothetical protein VGV85_11435 [Longimicrobiaceae bacterium]|nr:hypothetical protein [Longimicrobiaceae bacterium]